MQSREFVEVLVAMRILLGKTCRAARAQERRRDKTKQQELQVRTASGQCVYCGAWGSHIAGPKRQEQNNKKRGWNRAQATQKKHEAEASIELRMF